MSCLALSFAHLWSYMVACLRSLQVYNEVLSDLLAPPPVEEDFVPLKPKERIALETKLKKLRKATPVDDAAVNKLLCLLDPEEAQKQSAAVMPKVCRRPRGCQASFLSQPHGCWSKLRWESHSCAASKEKSWGLFEDAPQSMYPAMYCT